MAVCANIILMENATDTVLNLDAAAVNLKMTEYEKGYQQALLDINTPKQVIIEKWNPSKCPRCGGDFEEECDDGYYNRAIQTLRCPNCGQRLLWY